MNKKNILKIFITVFAALVIVGAFLLINKSTKAIDQGTVFIEIIDENNNIIKSKEIKYKEEDTLVDLIQTNFENVLIENGMLMTIESLITPTDWSYFIAIYTNNLMSEVGIKDILLIDNLKVSFIYTQLEY